MSAAADVLSIVRLLAALLFPAALGTALAGAKRWVPLGLFAMAAGSDFLDGILARRARAPTSYGALLDNLADITFVLAATTSAAALGLLSWLPSMAIAAAFAAYTAASLRRAAGWRPARSATGHAAGVLNYTLAGLVAGAALLPGSPVAAALGPAGLLVAGVNLAAVLDRLVPRRPPRAPASRA